MGCLRDWWAVIAGAVMYWLTSCDNEVLSTIVHLLTILVMLIGLSDWCLRKICKRTEYKPKPALKALESTQRPFKAVNILNNPMETGEKIGTIIEDTTNILGGKKMKRVFKWIWYNKEQLLAIVYQVVLLAVANVVLFTNSFHTFVTVNLGLPLPLWVKLIVVGLALALTALSVRNVVVTYGLSSLETIEAVLTERAEAKASKLSPEQKQIYKNYINTLNGTLAKVKKELQVAEDEFTRMTILYNADNTLVPDYTSRTITYQKNIASYKETIGSLETKIANFKALLSGQVVNK